MAISAATPTCARPRRRRQPLAAIAAILAILALPSGAAAQSADQELAETYAPIIVLKDQTGPCDPDGEPFAPMSVDLVLDNNDVTLRQAGTGDPVVQRAPVASDLFGRGDGFFLDFNGLALDPGCVYEENYQAYANGVDPVVYAHVVQQADEPDKLAVQYWLCWYYNDWNNKHESDWEFIQILFDAPTAADALRVGPSSVGYAQHEGDERAAWGDAKLERSATHPVVYSSARSHASYFEPDIYLGRRGTEGFGCDTTTGPSTRIEPAVVLLPSEVDAASDEFAWLGFDGRWGERRSGPFNGPTGPNTKPQWTAPIDWQDGLRTRSVTIPGGGENSGTVLDTFCSVVEFGSERLREAQVNPTRLIVLLGAGALVVRWLARRTTWSAVPATPLRQRRSIGQMIRGSVTAYWHSNGGILAASVLYVPAAVIVGLIAWSAGFQAGQTALGALTTIMFVTTSAVLAVFWHLASSRRRAIVEAPALLRERVPAMLATLVRAAVIVVGLAITIVAIPWAIRQLIRYVYAVPVTITEAMSGKRALARSSELVRGRWWRTAIPVVLFGGLAALVNSALQLVLLIAFAGVPLWLYLAVSFAVTGLVVPLLVTPSLLLYGDAAAVHAEQRAALTDDFYDDSAVAVT